MDLADSVVWLEIARTVDAGLPMPWHMRSTVDTWALESDIPPGSPVTIEESVVAETVALAIVKGEEDVVPMRTAMAPVVVTLAPPLISKALMPVKPAVSAMDPAETTAPALIVSCALIVVLSTGTMTEIASPTEREPPLKVME